MADLRLSALAVQDLVDIRTWGFHEHGAVAAERHLAGFEQVFDRLRRHPEAGQERPEFALGIRSIPHRPHRVLYRLMAGTVVIERIIHLARDVRIALAEPS